MEHWCLVGMESAVLHCKEWSFWPSPVDPSLPLLLGRRSFLPPVGTKEGAKRDNHTTRTQMLLLWTVESLSMLPSSSSSGMNGIQPKQHIGFYFNLVKCIVSTYLPNLKMPYEPKPTIIVPKWIELHCNWQINQLSSVVYCFITLYNYHCNNAV